MPSLWIPIYGIRESHGWEFAQTCPFDTFEEACEYVTDRGDRDDGFSFLGIQCPTRFMDAREFEDQQLAMEIARQIEREEDARQLSRAAAGGW